MAAGRNPRAGRHARAALLAAVLLGPTLSACSSAVEVAPPAQASSPACAAVARAWPSTVGNQHRRDTTSSSPAVRAWGDPPIIARCGVAPIGPTTDECIDVSGIDWVAHRLSDGVRFTTYGRSPAIEVLVPHAYQPEPLVLPAFGRAAGAIPQDEHRCR
jgi:hypothetical protein